MMCRQRAGETCDHPTYCNDKGCPHKPSAVPFKRVFDAAQVVPQIVALDVDEVVAALLPAWLAAYNRDYDDDLTPEDIREWDLSLAVKPECGTKIYSYLDTPKLYEDVKPVEGALRGIATLRAWGHRAIFVTSAMNGHAGAKLRLLQRFGVLNAHLRVDPSYFECSDKSLIAADVLVDDRPKNVEDFPGRTILFRQPHNESFNAPDVQARGWEEVCYAVDAIGYDAKLTRDNMRGMVDSFNKMRPLVSEPFRVETTTPATAPDATGDVRDPSTAADVAVAGVKFDQGKPRFDLIPSWPLWVIAQVYAFGAVKYDDHNWRKGMRWGRVMAATKRHIARWEAREDSARDSNLHHLAHAAFGLLTLIEYAVIAREFDDRPSKVAQIPDEGETLPTLFALPATADQ
jgi:5'-nucleotidase